MLTNKVQVQCDPGTAPAASARHLPAVLGPMHVLRVPAYSRLGMHSRVGQKLTMDAQVRPGYGTLVHWHATFQGLGEPDACRCTSMQLCSGSTWCQCRCH